MEQVAVVAGGSILSGKKRKRRMRRLRRGGCPSWCYPCSRQQHAHAAGVCALPGRETALSSLLSARATATPRPWRSLPPRRLGDAYETCTCCRAAPVRLAPMSASAARAGPNRPCCGYVFWLQARFLASGAFSRPLSEQHNKPLTEQARLFLIS